MRYLRETLAVEILCVFFFISKTEAIKCYQCDSSDPGCSSLTIADVNSTYLMECGSEHPKPFCRKTIQTILDSNNLVRITRTCGWLTKSRNDTKCYKQDTQFKFDTTCQCHTDGCNAAPSVFAGTTFGVLVSATLISRCDLSCYSCSSKQTLTCLHPKRNNLPLKKCVAAELDETKKYAENLDAKFGQIFDVSLLPSDDRIVPMNCMKQVTIVGKEEYTIRGCQLKIEHPDICNKVYATANKERINVTHCSECETDGCNAAVRTQPAGFIVAVITACLFKSM